MDTNETETAIDKPRRGRRAGAIVGAGIFAGLIAAALGGVASAQSIAVTQVDAEPIAVQVDGDDANDGEVDRDYDHDISPADKAIFEQFEQCLTNAGIDLDSEDGEVSELDEAALDSAFEQCDPILDDLSDDFAGFTSDLSAEDEAVFDRYDTCLSDAGLDFEAFEEESEVDESALDAAFEQCDPILDELSAEAQELFEGCDEEDEADDHTGGEDE